MQITKKNLKKLNFNRGSFIPYFSLVAVLIATAGATMLFYDSARKIDELRFEANTAKIESRLEKLVNIQSLVLYTLRESDRPDPFTEPDIFSGESAPDIAGVFESSRRANSSVGVAHVPAAEITVLSETGTQRRIDPLSIEFEQANDVGRGNKVSVGWVDLKDANSRVEGGLLFFKRAEDQPSEASFNPEKRRYLFTVVSATTLRKVLSQVTASGQIRTILEIGNKRLSVPVAQDQEFQRVTGQQRGSQRIGSSAGSITVRFRALDEFYQESRLNLTVVIPVIGILLGVLVFGLLRFEVKSRKAISDFAKALNGARRENAALLVREKEARKQAEMSNRSKDEFMATISHEIRTPLNAIAGWARILDDKNLAEQTRIDALETIKRNIKKQSKIINELLLFSSLKTEEASLRHDLTKASELIDEIAESVKPSIEQKQIRFLKENNLSDEQFYCDRKKIVTALQNLVQNAIKFTPDGGEIRLFAQRQDDFLNLLIEDSGKGIKKEFLPFIFDKFRQSDQSTTRQFGGLGLGLAISKQIIKLHGGFIRVRSNGEDSGAQFEVRIPFSAYGPQKISG